MLKPLSVALFVILAPAWCQNQTCDSCRYGLVHMTDRQTLPVNVAAPPGQSCSAQVGFNSNGNPIQAPTSVSLEPGQSKPVPYRKDITTQIHDGVVPLVGAQELVHILGGAYGVVPTTEHLVGNEVELSISASEILIPVS